VTIFVEPWRQRVLLRIFYKIQRSRRDEETERQELRVGRQERTEGRRDGAMRSLYLSHFVSESDTGVGGRRAKRKGHNNRMILDKAFGGMIRRSSCGTDA